MGNLCYTNPTPPQQTTMPIISIFTNKINPSPFLSLCWSTLKFNGKLNRFPLNKQDLIYYQLLKIQSANEEKRIMWLNKQQNILVVFKKNDYIYIGGIQNQLFNDIHGSIVYGNKKFYQGGFVNGQFGGAGKMEFYIQDEIGEHRCVFDGSWSNDVAGWLTVNKDLIKKYIQVKRSTIAESNVKLISYFNDDFYVGEVKDQLAHGYGKYYHRKESVIGDLTEELDMYVIYQGEFRDGLRQGRGILHYDADKSLDINWKHGKPHGEGIYLLGRQTCSVYYNEGVRIINAVSAISE